MGRWGGRDSERAGERDRRPAEESREDPSEAASRRGLAVARSEMERLASGGYDAGQTYRAVVNGVATVEARDPDHALRKARELFPQRQLDVRIMRGM